MTDTHATDAERLREEIHVAISSNQHLLRMGYADAAVNAILGLPAIARAVAAPVEGEAGEMVKRLLAEEQRMRVLFDFVVAQRDKNAGTPSFGDINRIKHAVAGRDPVFEDAAALITSLSARLAKTERERDEAVADETEACAKLADEHTPRISHDGPSSPVHEAEYMTAGNIAAAIRARRQADATASTVLDEIAAERRRQIQGEGWTPEHDDQHGNGEMARAAGCYALHAGQPEVAQVPKPYAPADWPWDRSWWKPKDRRRDLIRAAALLVAEIERLDRTAAPATTTEGGEDVEEH